MSCEQNRGRFFAILAREPAIAAALPGQTPVQIAGVIRAIYDAGTQRRLAPAIAVAQTRQIFAEMDACGISPPVHSPTGLPKPAAQQGYAAVATWLAECRQRHATPAPVPAAARADDAPPRRTRGQDRRLVRTSATRLTLPHPTIPIRVFANADVAIEPVAIDELSTMVASLETAVSHLHAARPAAFGDADPAIVGVACSSDLHKGTAIPIGTTLVTRGFGVPQAMGSDINCGMLMIKTSLRASQITAARPQLAAALRDVFFGGKRNVAADPAQRTRLLTHGMAGLIGDDPSLAHRHDGGGYATDLHPAFADYVRGAGGRSHDSHLGSLGGGNHFAEIQEVQAIHDPQVAYHWGLRPGDVVIMVHSGSLGFGHVASGAITQLLHDSWPAGVPRPANGIYPLPYADTARWTTIRTLIRNAANFAFGNRHTLATMVTQVLRQHCGTMDTALLYDAPHNLLWETPEGETTHRKGSTPARGYDAMVDSPFAYTGEPVLVPGSMGATSYVLRGQGNTDAYASACHGAGRALARGAAMRGDDAALDAFLTRFTVVTPIDPARPDLRGRRDIVDAWRADLKQEAPWAYKDIDAAISTLAAADVAQPVAAFAPLLTMKG